MSQKPTTVALDTQLAQDATTLLQHYFGGAIITAIQAEYHHGYLMEEYSIALTCTVEHPAVEQVTMGFDHLEVPRTPSSWSDLCDMHIALLLTGLTLREYNTGIGVTYSTPGLYGEQIHAWCKTHGDGVLYAFLQTPETFIIHTHDVDHAALERSIGASSVNPDTTNTAHSIPTAFYRAFEDEDQLS